MNQQRGRRLSAMTAVFAVVSITLTACGGVSEVERHDVTRVPIMSDAAAQATREAPLNPASPQAGEATAPAAQTPAPAEAAQAAPVEIDAFDIYFEPKQVTIPANTDVTISLPNKGVSAHDFSIDALGISVALPPGETQTVTINAPAGTYEFYCNVPGHKEAGMVGELIVSAEAATTAPPAAPATEGATPSAQGATPVAAAPAAGTPASATAAAIASGPAPSAAGEVHLTAKDIFFEPKEISIPANTDVKSSIANEGVAPHNFSIDALKISVDLPPGETTQVVVNATPGTYEFYCNVPGHKEAGMVGTLIVTAEAATTASPAAPAAGGTTPVAAAPAVSTPASTTAAATASGAAPAAAKAVQIAAKDIFFEPKDVSIPANTDVTFTIDNEGAAPHNFAIDALKISVDLAPGETKEVVVNAPPGTYEFYCNVPGHKEAGMVGTLTVE